MRGFNSLECRPRNQNQAQKNKINNIFKEAIILPLQSHVIDDTHLPFSDMTHKLVEKENILMKLGFMKYGEDDKPKAKDKRQK